MRDESGGRKRLPFIVYTSKRVSVFTYKEIQHDYCVVPTRLIKQRSQLLIKFGPDIFRLQNAFALNRLRRNSLVSKKILYVYAQNKVTSLKQFKV